MSYEQLFPTLLSACEGRAQLLKSPRDGDMVTGDDVRHVVESILDDVRENGAAAVRAQSARLDKWSPEQFRVTPEQIEAATAAVPAELRAHIEFAHANIEAFARRQLACLQPLSVEVADGVTLGHSLVPVESVGCYVPGGRYPLIASALMSILTARIAGVRRVVACAPPRNADGIDPVQLFTMQLAGADEIYCVGGVQALGALAYGAEGFGKPVDMLVGPGNAYVAEAKRQLFGRVGIDLLAGPTEVLVVADGSADPELVATDLLGQAEHGANSPAWLVTTSEQLGQEVVEAVERLLPTWPTREVAGAAWQQLGAVFVCDDDETALAVADELAAEHVEIHTAEPDWWLANLRNYGTLFVGADSTVAYSDKAIGTNHTLPTGRAARYTGGLWVGSFVKVLSFQRVAPGADSERIAAATAAISDAEGLLGHALTARVRMSSAKQTVSSQD